MRRSQDWLFAVVLDEISVGGKKWTKPRPTSSQHLIVFIISAEIILKWLESYFYVLIIASSW